MKSESLPKVVTSCVSRSDVRLEPISDDDLDNVARFLHDNLNASYEWRSFLGAHWTEDYPNHGFFLRDGTRIGGVIGALYSSQNVRGRSELFCNIHGWCVLEEYRAHSLKLLLALIGQTNYHLTALTPNRESAKVLRAMKFRVMEGEQRIVLNMPWPNRDAAVIADPDKLEQLLPASDAVVVREHRHLPLLEMIAVGRGDARCLVVFKKSVRGGGRFAVVLHVSDVPLFARHQDAFRNYLLLRRGVAAFKIDSRFLTRPTLMSGRVRNSAVRLFFSRTLNVADMCGLYSELTVLP